MRRFAPWTIQKHVDFAEHKHRHVIHLFKLEMRADDFCQALNGVALDFCFQVSKFVDNQGNDCLSHFSFVGHWTHFGKNVQCKSSVILEVAVGQLLKRRRDKFSEDFAKTMVKVRLDKLIV